MMDTCNQLQAILAILVVEAISKTPIRKLLNLDQFFPRVVIGAA